MDLGPLHTIITVLLYLIPNNPIPSFFLISLLYSNEYDHGLNNYFRALALNKKQGQLWMMEILYGLYVTF